MYHSQHDENSFVCVNFGIECKRLNLKQIDIGKSLEVSPKTVARWQTKIAIPSDQLAKLVELGFDPYFVMTGRRQEIDTDILKETLRVMLPVLPAMGDDIDVKTKMVGMTYNTLLEEHVKKTKARLNITADMGEANRGSQTIEGNQNTQSGNGKVNQSIKGDGNKQTLKNKK